MPAGLDGNPDPIDTSARSSVIDTVVSFIASTRAAGRPMLVAVDGIDGAGKSTFADEIADSAREHGMSIVRSTIDSFHNERRLRHARGPASPLGLYLDSHNLAALQRELLDPFTAGEGASYRAAVFDEPTDSLVEAVPGTVRSDDVLIFDGLFVQRPELVTYWDAVVFLDAQRRVDLNRLGLVLDDLPSDPIEVVAHTLTWSARVERYSSGLRHYLDLVDPAGSADLVIDNNDIRTPFVVERR